MKTINKIPTSKLQRASALVKTGAKVGVNYIKYYGDKLTKSEEEAKTRLNENNAEDIYDSLSNLKGSTLKVAQMLSMEKGMLPQEYVDKFSLSQFSVPPLSPPLVKKTFRKYFNQNPEDLFDSFDAQSVNAASIGQVHKATKEGNLLAVKIQYPGVADSIKADLTMVKPIATRMFNLGKAADLDKYFDEVENKLIEETNYYLEIEQSQYVKDQCSHIPNLSFPNYYPELSSDRILTMDWMEGQHLSEFVNHNYNQQSANKLGQTLWNFYMYQIHVLKKVHADPHPGNFLVNKNFDLIALDFGCMKTIPEDFYKPYFELIEPQYLNHPKRFEEKMVELEILLPTDSKEERDFFISVFHEMISTFTSPFNHEVFDFGDPTFYGKIFELSQQYSKSSEIRKYNPSRGSKHFIYMNRTFFGLYHLLFDLKANGIKTKQFLEFKT